MTRGEPAQITASQRALSWIATLASGALLSRFFAAGLDPRWIFLASIAVFGLAHGACDLWVPSWVLERRMSRWFLAAFCVVYLALAGAVLLVWRVQPGVALTGFLCLTAWHWGSTDAMSTGTTGWRLHSLAWGRGLLVMTAPAAFHPAAAGRVLTTLSTAFAALPVERLQVVAMTVLIFGIGLELLVPAGQDGASLQLISHHVETLFLLGLFRVFAPLEATALYLVWFHAWRHIVRLCRWQSPDATSLWRSVVRFHRAALPCSIGALGLLWWVAGQWPGDLLRAYLILLSAVTLPHALLVLWLDRVEILQSASAGRPSMRPTTAARWVPLAP